MVEIVRRGKIPGEEQFTDTCRNCVTIFRYYRREAKNVPQRDGGRILRIKCPVCGIVAIRAVET